MIKTLELPVTRGQTLRRRFTIKNQRGIAQDLTGAIVYMWVRADMKVAPCIKLASEAVTDHRIGFTILDQVTNIGEVALTMIPSDTSELVALGAADPYLYDIWVVFADGSEFPIISLSRMPLFAQASR